MEVRRREELWERLVGLFGVWILVLRFCSWVFGVSVFLFVMCGSNGFGLGDDVYKVFILVGS